MYPTKDENLPQGTIDTYYDYSGPLSKAIDVANHYGFHLVKPLKADVPSRTQNSNIFYIPDELKLAALNHYKKQLTGWPHPVRVCYTRFSRRKVANLHLEIFGTSRSIAEALLIKAALAILTDHGHKNTTVAVNSLGSVDNSANFLEDFRAYYRKNISSLGACCQDTFRNDALGVTQCTNSACASLLEGAPRSIAFLSEDERCHLKEIIEYIETMQVPYVIDSSLTGSEAHRPRTLFQIRGKDRNTILARGERYDHFVSKAGIRKTLPSVGISIDLKAGKREHYAKCPAEQHKNPPIYFVHIGMEAKRLSLPVLDELRRRNIRVLQALTKDSMYYQMRHAEKLRVPLVVIMGIKEAMERAVIVRNMETQAQQTIEITRLPTYLKKVVREINV